MAFSENDGWKRAMAMLPGVPLRRSRAHARRATNDMAGAAREMENAGLVAAAAIYREKADDWRGARALWSRLAQVVGGGADAYNGALVQFNLARCAKKCGDARQAHDAIVASVRLLEEAADYFESVGQRERAFDCFQVLVQIGRESGMFEDVLEGFVNCIRILREDHLKYFALQYFEDALAGGEGATRVLRRGDARARGRRLRARARHEPSASAHYVVVQAELWRDVAKQHLERGAPPEIAENALLAAILAFGEVGQYARVGRLYDELAMMDLEERARKHYARAAKRYDGVRDEPIDTAPLPVAPPPGQPVPRRVARRPHRVGAARQRRRGVRRRAPRQALAGSDPAQGDARAPHGVRGGEPPRGRERSGDRGARAPRRAARAAAALRACSRRSRSSSRAPSGR